MVQLHDIVDTRRADVSANVHAVLYRAFRFDAAHVGKALPDCDGISLYLSGDDRRNGASGIPWS